MSEITVNFDATPNPDPDPCYLNAHRWAWLVDGRQACGYCGVMR